MKMYLMTAVASLFSITMTTSAFAASKFYPTSFVNNVEVNNKQGHDLKLEIFEILTSDHQTHPNSNDTLGCTPQNTGRCYQRKSLSYRDARKVLFGTLHLEKDNQGFFVKDVYCNQVLRSNDTAIGKGKIPNNTVMNCEHTWPQSRFSRRFDKSIQKTDLHHLFPTNSRANSIRGHYRFGEVQQKGQPLRGCSDSSSEKGGEKRFQPPAEHRGNVARALFYFSVHYQKPIDPTEEKFLRKWDREDPIDAKEIERNDMIYNVQKNRNPFIDFPNLADSISDF